MNKERLLTLLAHMREGKLSVDKFDFSTFRTEYTNIPTVIDSCGTAGCMAGELPAAFPGIWKLHRTKLGSTSGYGSYYPVLVEGNFDIAGGNQAFKHDAKVFFELSDDEVRYLFYPREDYAEGGLPDEATREEVADQLEYFIEAGGLSR